MGRKKKRKRIDHPLFFFLSCRLKKPGSSSSKKAQLHLHPNWLFLSYLVRPVSLIISLLKGLFLARLDLNRFSTPYQVSPTACLITEAHTTVVNSLYYSCLPECLPSVYTHTIQDLYKAFIHHKRKGVDSR